jgi:DNA-binding MarR family transcriptional regulator
MGKKSKGKGKDKGARKERKRALLAAARAAAPQDADLDITNGAAPDSPAEPSGGPRDQRVDPAELAARLASLSTVLQRHLARADVGDGLTRSRLSALALLVLGGPRTLGELAAAEHVRPPTMTRMVQAMESDGLVERTPHPRDGRSVVIGATAAGIEQLESGRARQIAPLAAAVSALTAGERARLEEASDLLGRVLRQTTWEPTTEDA